MISSSFFLHSAIPVPYLIIGFVLAFIACMMYPTFRLAFKIFLILRKYSFIIIFFISSFFTQSNCNTPRCFYPFSSSIFIIYVLSYLHSVFYSFTLRNFTSVFFISNIAHLEIPYCIPVSLLKILTVCTRETDSCIVLP